MDQTLKAALDRVILDTEHQQSKTPGCLACDSRFPAGWQHSLGCEHHRKPGPGVIVKAASHVRFESEPVPQFTRFRPETQESRDDALSDLDPLTPEQEAELARIAPAHSDDWLTKALGDCWRCSRRERAARHKCLECGSELCSQCMDRARNVCVDCAEEDSQA